jgi:hypothetical protein
MPKTITVLRPAKRNCKHIAKHLKAFQELDPNMSLEDIIDLGIEIAGDSRNYFKTKGDNKAFGTVGGRTVKVRAVLNRDRRLRTVFIEKE